jgi:predicted small metal-binding protein
LLDHRKRHSEMKTFACGAVVPGCTTTFAAETEDEVLEQVVRHAREDHGLPEVPEELLQQVRANLR